MLIDIVSMRYFYAEPRILTEVCSVWINFIHWIKTSSMIEDHIHDDSHTSLVTLINESTEIILTTISFVHCEIMIRRITPVIITIKLADRHQFNGIDAKILYVIKAIDQSAETTFRCIVIYPKFVNDKIVFVRALEIKCGIAPLVLWLLSLHHCHITITL